MITPSARYYRPLHAITAALAHDHGPARYS